MGSDGQRKSKGHLATTDTQSRGSKRKIKSTRCEEGSNLVKALGLIAFQSKPFEVVSLIYRMDVL